MIGPRGPCDSIRLSSLQLLSESANPYTSKSAAMGAEYPTQSIGIASCEEDGTIGQEVDLIGVGEDCVESDVRSNG